MARPTPARGHLSALVTRTAQRLLEQGARGVRRPAWSHKTRPPCADAMAWVQRQGWEHSHVAMSHQETALRQIPRDWFERFSDTVCYAM